MTSTAAGEAHIWLLGARWIWDGEGTMILVRGSAVGAPLDNHFDGVKSSNRGWTRRGWVGVVKELSQASRVGWSCRGGTVPGVEDGLLSWTRMPRACCYFPTRTSVTSLRIFIFSLQHSLTILRQGLSGSLLAPVVNKHSHTRLAGERSPTHLQITTHSLIIIKMEKNQAMRKSFNL